MPLIYIYGVGKEEGVKERRVKKWEGREEGGRRCTSGGMAVPSGWSRPQAPPPS